MIGISKPFLTLFAIFYSSVLGTLGSAQVIARVWAVLIDIYRSSIVIRWWAGDASVLSPDADVIEVYQAYYTVSINFPASLQASS